MAVHAGPVAEAAVDIAKTGRVEGESAAAQKSADDVAGVAKKKGTPGEPTGTKPEAKKVPDAASAPVGPEVEGAASPDKPIASEPLEGGVGTVQITEQANVNICTSPCVRCRKRFAGALSRNHELLEELESIEADAKEAARLHRDKATEAAGIELAEKANHRANELLRKLRDETTTGDLRARFRAVTRRADKPLRAEAVEYLEEKLSSLEQRAKDLEAMPANSPEAQDARSSLREDLESVEREIDVAERTGELKIPDIEADVPPSVARKRRQILESFAEFVKDDPGLDNVKLLDPDAKFGIQGSVVRGRVGNKNKPTFGRSFDPKDFDMDFFVISDRLPRSEKVVGLQFMRDRFARRFPGVLDGLREDSKGLSVKVFRPGERIPDPFLILR
jgi:hypothetical protein